MAEITSNIARVPFEQVKQRLQTDQYPSLTSAFKNIIKIHGLKGIYQGLAPQILRDIPFSIIQIPIYEFLKRKHNKNDFHKYYYGFYGTIAGSTAAFLTTPLDVIKTLIMTNRSKDELKWKKAVLIIWERKGLLGFFKGGFYRVTYLGLISFNFFLSYEIFCHYFDKIFLE